MKNTTKSLLDSLVDIYPTKDTSLIIESRGTHIISSIISLLETIDNYYGEDAANDMEKRIFSSIRSRNIGKFSRGIRNIAEGKQYDTKKAK